MGIWVFICKAVKRAGVLNHPNVLALILKLLAITVGACILNSYTINYDLSYFESVFVSLTMAADYVLSLSLYVSTIGLF